MALLVLLDLQSNSHIGIFSEHLHSKRELLLGIHIVIVINFLKVDMYSEINIVLMADSLFICLITRPSWSYFI